MAGLMEKHLGSWKAGQKECLMVGLMVSWMADLMGKPLGVLEG